LRAVSGLRSAAVRHFSSRFVEHRAALADREVSASRFIEHRATLADTTARRVAASVSSAFSIRPLCVSIRRASSSSCHRHANTSSFEREIIALSRFVEHRAALALALLTIDPPHAKIEVMSRATNFVREFKGARGFKDGWYYQLTNGHSWIGPFVTGHMAECAREHVIRNARDLWSEPEWLQISTSVALGRVVRPPPPGARGASAVKMTTASPHAAPVPVPASLALPSNGYQARPRLALSARRQPPTVRAESAAPQPVTVTRRRGARTV
jgi:hypothetical protein